MKLKSNVIRTISILIALLILLTLIWYANPSQLLTVLSKSDLRFILIAFVISSIAMCLRTLKWCVLIKINFRELFSIQMLGMTISNFTPGKIAEPAKNVILKMKKGIAVSESLPTVIWERIMDVIVLILLSTFAIHLLSGRFFMVGAFAISLFLILIIMLLLILHKKKIGMKIFSLLRKLPILKISNEFIETFYKSKIDRKRLVLCFLLTFVPWMLEGVILYFAFLSIDISLSPFTLACILALSTLIGVASFLPGGLGSTEAVMTLFLGILGISASTAVAGILIARFLSFWYGSFLGFLSFLYLSKKISLKNIA